MKVLIAEDEVSIAKGLKSLLEKQKILVDVVHNGLDALENLHRFQYNVVVLDIMMPGLDGLSVLKQIRQEKSYAAVMMLSEKDETEDRIIALEAGADDYLPKPFTSREFIARIKALVRRNIREYNGGVLQFGNVQLDCNRYELCCGSERIRLRNKEFQLLELFFWHPQFVFTTERLMDMIWGTDSVSGIESVWTYIGFLRKKLKDIGADVEIKTVRGVGYSLEEKKD